MTLPVQAMTLPADDLDALRSQLRQFVEQRDWQRFHNPKNLAMLLASEAGELLAEYRWVSTEDADEHSKEPAAHQRIIKEIGDIGIAVMLLCDRLGIDLVAAIEQKIALNAANYPAEQARGRAERPPQHSAASR